MSSMPSGATARETIWRTAWSSSSSVSLRLGSRALGQRRPHRLEERHVVADADGFGMRHRQRKGLRERPHGAEAAFLAVLLCEDVLLRGRQQAEPRPQVTP